MSFAEKYVTQGAGGTGDGTSGDPWTLAEALTQAVAGDRVNVQSDAGYSLGADAVTNTGTAINFIIFRGYNSSIGDLEGQGRNADSSLNTTNYPVITLTGTLAPSDWSFFQNLSFTGAVNGNILGAGSADYWFVISCSVVNSASNGSARGLFLDNDCGVINSDISCTGATHTQVIIADVRLTLDGNRITGTLSTATLVTCVNGIFVGNTFVGSTSGIGLNLEQAADFQYLRNNTFYGIGTAIETPNAAQTRPFFLINNHSTDNTTYLDNLYTATANHSVIEINSRTRDNTAGRVGFDPSINIAEVTTDTGGAATDYEDAPDDLTLIAAAPAVDAGMGI